MIPFSEKKLLRLLVWNIKLLTSDMMTSLPPPVPLWKAWMYFFIQDFCPLWLILIFMSIKTDGCSDLSLHSPGTGKSSSLTGIWSHGWNKYCYTQYYSTALLCRQTNVCLSVVFVLVLFYIIKALDSMMCMKYFVSVQNDFTVRVGLKWFVLWRLNFSCSPSPLVWSEWTKLQISDINLFNAQQITWNFLTQ